MSALLLAPLVLLVAACNSSSNAAAEARAACVLITSKPGPSGASKAAGLAASAAKADSIWKPLATALARKSTSSQATIRTECMAVGITVGPS